MRKPRTSLIRNRGITLLLAFVMLFSILAPAGSAQEPLPPEQKVAAEDTALTEEPAVSPALPETGAALTVVAPTPSEGQAAPTPAAEGSTPMPVIEENPAPDGTPAGTPNETPNVIPGETPNDTPVTPNETLNTTPNETPNTPPAGTPVEAPNEAPQETPAGAADRKTDAAQSEDPQKPDAATAVSPAVPSGTPEALPQPDAEETQPDDAGNTTEAGDTPAFVGEYKADGGISITVTAGEGVLPRDTKLAVVEQEILKNPESDPDALLQAESLPMMLQSSPPRMALFGLNPEASVAGNGDTAPDSAASASEAESPEPGASPELVVAASYTYDISLTDASGNAVPLPEDATATLRFALPEAWDPNLTARVIHHAAAGDELLSPTVENGVVTVVTTGFSAYTVEFTYQKKAAVLDAGSSISAGTLLSRCDVQLRYDNLLRLFQSVLDVRVEGGGDLITLEKNNMDPSLSSIQVKANLSAADLNKTARVIIRVGTRILGIESSATDYIINVSCLAPLGPVKYLDRSSGAAGELKEVTDYRMISPERTQITKFSENGWYVFSGETVYRAPTASTIMTLGIVSEARIEVTGSDVRFILTDGCKVSAKLGIHIAPGAHLTIYGQKKDSGVLDASIDAGTLHSIFGSLRMAGIGGNEKETGGSLTIHGGTVTTAGANKAAGIGAGSEGSFGNITIYGGTVKATGGSDGAGIGGGAYGGSIAAITINGGTVTAYGGGMDGAGIGGGGDCADGGSVTINGGTVKAYGGGGNEYQGLAPSGKGAGIGGGRNRTGPGSITINGGTVKAFGSYEGAGIGGGSDGKSCPILITSGTVEASTGDKSAGIGGGKGQSNGPVTIRGGMVTASCGTVYEHKTFGGAGIGGGTGAPQGDAINIEGGSVVAHSQCGAGIGGGGAYGRAGGVVNISGGNVAATSVTGAGIGGGGHYRTFDRYRDLGYGGTVNISGGNVFAASQQGGAAIGGGAGVRGGTVNISGGFVTAVTSSVTYDWINDVATANKAKAGEEYAIFMAKLLGRLFFSHPEKKSPAAIGGGCAGDHGGAAGSFTYTGGVLSAQSGYTEVPAIGAGSGGSVEKRVLSAQGNFMVMYSDNVDAKLRDMELAKAAERQQMLENKANVLIAPCTHLDAKYDITPTTHTIHCDYCTIADQGAQPHTFDANGVCTVCRYHQSREFTAALDLPFFPYVYDGTEKRPPVEAKGSGADLIAGQDYTVAYQNNVNAGTAKAIVTGLGGYTGVKKLEFEIEPASIDHAELSETQLTYNGSEQTVNVVRVTTGGMPVPVEAYTVSDNTAVDVGIYAATATAKPGTNYIGAASASYEIAPKDISAAQAVLSGTAFVYDGTAKIPGLRVTDGGRLLEFEEDYECECSGNVHAGTATLMINGKNNYIGSKTLSFTIAKTEIDSLRLEESIFIHNGQDHAVRVAAVSAGSLAVPAEAYTLTLKNAGGAVVTAVKDVGEYTLTLTAKPESDFTGSVTVPVSVLEQSVKSFYVELEETDYVYNGTARTPAVRVTDTGRPLTEGTDYTLQYLDNTDAGMAKVKVTGAGSYRGTRIFTFRIAPAKIDAAELSETTLPYTGTVRAVSVTRVMAGELSVPADAYTVIGTEAMDTGDYEVLITAKDGGNFTGSVKVPFSIVPADAKAFTVAFPEALEFIYDGSEKKPAVLVTDSGELLYEGEDYSLLYQDNTDAGFGKVLVSGRGNYNGTRVFTFRIDPAPIDSVSTSDSILTYNGAEQTVSVTGVKAGSLDVPADAWIVNGNSAVDTGEYELTVTAKESSNFTGSVTVPFHILPEGAKTFYAELSETEFTYDGTAKRPAVTVTDTGRPLTEGTDYTLQYRDNLNAGTGKVLVTGIGNYYGTRVFTFRIEPAVLDDADLTSYLLPYSGEVQEVRVTAVRAGALEVPPEAYTVLGGSGSAIGAYPVIINAKDGGNFTGQVEVWFAIDEEAEVEYYFTYITSAWLKGRPNGAEFRVSRSPSDNLTFALFEEAKVDGAVLSPESYETAAGSLILTLKQPYMSALATGEHTLTVTFRDGEASTEFRVTELPPSPPPTVTPTITPSPTVRPSIRPTPIPTQTPSGLAPKTGDESRTALWATAALLSAAGTAAAFHLLRRRKHR